MNRLLALAAALLVAGHALADIPPPPPPKGKKYVSVSNEVVLGKDVTGYVFVQRVGTGPGRPTFTYEKVELTPGKAATVPTPGRRGSVALIAVPQDAAKEFKTDAELFDALKERKVKGTHDLGFPGSATVPDSIKGDTVKWTHTVTAIDPKGGFKATVEGEGRPAAKGEAPGKPEEEDGAEARAPRGGTWVAGLAAALAAALGGLWAVGRARRAR